MALSSRADCSAPGISPRPVRGSRPTQGRLNVPRPVGIDRHPTRAMHRAQGVRSNVCTDILG
eukprot:1573081-Prymnesium_polylepis.1